jgi:hypothetical protein
MAVGGVLLLVQVWPIAAGAWYAQQADAIFTDLRLGRPLDSLRVRAGIKHLDDSVAAQPSAERWLSRGEFLEGVATWPDYNIPDQERRAWLLKARGDLERGLSDAPGRGLEWLRLAFVHLIADGPSRDVIPPLLLSMETAPFAPHVWPARLSYILDTWPYFDDAQKEFLRPYILRAWRHSPDRTYFAKAVHSPVDELILRFFLRGEPGAEEELSRLLKILKRP